MKLPNGEKAVVPKTKILDYLLGDRTKSARAKAGFFSRFGFARDDWRVLQIGLIQHGQAHDVEKLEVGAYGTRYTVVGELDCPDGRRPLVRTVWIIENGVDIPRLITAYPSRSRKHDQGT